MIYLSDKRHIDSETWKKMLDELHLTQKLASAKTIAIKPNLAAGAKADPERHICTDMNLMRNIVELCRLINPETKIYICEGDSTGDGFAYLKFEHFHLPEVVDPDGENGVETLDLSRDRLKYIEDKRFLYFKNGQNLWLSEKLVCADFKISLANLKTHSVTLYTGACKNLFGCLPASVKSVYHPYIHQVVHDLTLALNPDLNIVDAFYGMEKDGPVGGRDIDRSVRIFGSNAAEADFYGASIAGISPKKVKYLTCLSKDVSIEPVNEEKIKKYSFHAQLPGTCLRINNAIGLWIQRRGTEIINLGHRLHTAKTPVRAAIAIVRPMLIAVFGISRLKKQ